MNSDPKPRVTGTTHTLLFDKLSADAFERLTLWLVRREGFERAQHLGEAGSEQGRDIVAWKDGRRFAFQCKRVKAFSAAEGEAEIRKLLGLEAEEGPQEVVFVLPAGYIPTLVASLGGPLRRDPLERQDHGLVGPAPPQTCALGGRRREPQAARDSR